LGAQPAEALRIPWGFNRPTPDRCNRMRSSFFSDRNLEMPNFEVFSA
jgi:hypothetical protein